MFIFFFFKFLLNFSFPFASSDELSSSLIEDKINLKMNRLNFAKYLFNSVKQKPRFLLRSLGCFSGLALGVYTHYHYTYYTKGIFRTESYSTSNDIIGLTKNDYFDKILGNKKDFFFFIIYADSEENGRKMTKISKSLKKVADENGFESWNIYTINRNLFENIKTIVGKENAQTNILVDKEQPFPIEIYLKTPYHQDYFYIPFKENKFFSESSMKRLLKKMSKMRNLIESVHDEEDLNAKLWYGINKPNTPTVILRIDDKQHEKSAIHRYAQMVFMCFQRKVVPFDSKFMILNNPKLGDKLGLERNGLYILKNSVVQSYENLSGQAIEDYNNCVEIESQYPLTSKVFLEKYDGNLSLFENSGEEDQNDASKLNHFMKETKAFSEFLLPPVLVLQEIKQRQLTQFFRKSGQDRSKYTLSLFCSNTDPDRENKLSVFMNLYKRYKNEVNFCIFESDALQEMLPHSKPTQPSLILFNFFNRIEKFDSFKHYTSSINFPFEKFFLSSPFNAKLDFKEICESLEIVLDREGRLNQLNMYNENIQELTAAMIRDEVEKLEKMNQDGIIQVYDESNELESTKLELMFQRLSEDYNANLKFYRMGSLNKHPLLPISNGGPQIIYISPKTKKMIVLNSAYIRNEDQIQQFIQDIISTHK